MVSAEGSSGRSIQQTAGDGATQIGEVHGNIYIGSPAPEGEVSLDLDAYRTHQLSQLAIWERQYTRLDVDPAVALAGQDLRPVPDSRLALTEAFVRHERLVVVGGAGAGKTTSMLYLVASVLPGGTLSGSLTDLIPVYIELGRFRGDASMSPLDHLLLLIAETLFRGKACSEPPSLRGVRQLLADHRFLFLLDGLNEAQAGLRASCLAAIDDLAKLYPDQQMVLSSRPHGFSPPQGWEVVLLRELEDAQIPGFVERYLPDEASQVLLRKVLDARNPLLRLPLFLNLVIRMSCSPLPDLQRRLRSRSGLVAQYVDFLLQRDLSSATEVLSLHRLRDALERLAQAFQTSGQVLPLANVRKALEAGAPGNSEDARQILSDLCERGFLATDGQNLRFWHQTLQEYFYAGAIVRCWRGSKKKIGRMPWSLRRLAAKAEEEEALSFMVAHLSDGEFEEALSRGLHVNPALAISWADDLSLEGRALPATARFSTTVRQFTRAACRYTKIGSRKSSVLVGLGLLGACLGMAIVGISAFLSLVFLGKVAGLTARDEGLVMIMSLLSGLFLGFLPLLDALLRCPSEEKLESLLGAIPEIRDNSLRNALSALAREIGHSKMARREIRVLAQGISLMEVVSGEQLIMLIQTSDAPYIATRLIGHLDNPLAPPLLAELLKLNNSLSLAALEALVMRASRLRAERQKVKDLLWAVWNDGEMDYLIRWRARELLVRTGEQPGGRGGLLRFFALRFLKILPVSILLALIATILPLKILLIFCLSTSAMVFWDARRIGARHIHGHPRLGNGAPWNYAINAFFLPFLVPLYLLDRQRIRREAAPVDWNAILQVIQAQAPHGDSLSITHPPPSTPSARR